MKSITVNPTWNVPPSIVYGEYLPALQRDPTVLARMGLNVTYGRDGSVVSFRSRLVERDAIVLNNGRAEIHA